MSIVTRADTAGQCWKAEALLQQFLFSVVYSLIIVYKVILNV